MEKKGEEGKKRGLQESEPEASTISNVEVQEALRFFKGLMSFGQTSAEDRSNIIKEKINASLTAEENQRITAIFPPCADILLARCLVEANRQNEGSNHKMGEITVGQIFREYFSFEPHVAIPSAEPEQLKKVLSEGLLDCIGNRPVTIIGSTAGQAASTWPSSTCRPVGCVTLKGNRHIYQGVSNSNNLIKRLFLGDLAWLFYMERMGVFQVLGRIIDEYAYNGAIPISNGVVHLGDLTDDVLVVQLEQITEEMETGRSSKVRDRDSSYRRCLGWTSEPGKKLELKSVVNSGFNLQFHKFVHGAIQFFETKKLDVAIRTISAQNGGYTSPATLVSLRDDANLLRQNGVSFHYGRNYYNTLNGIVWAVAALSLVRDLRSTIGIPPEYKNLHQFFSAAYDILILKRPITQSDSNRFEAHMECATNARAILLDVEVVNIDDVSQNGDFEAWLMSSQARFYGYSTAYRTLTGVDLGATPNAVVEQKA